MVVLASARIKGGVLSLCEYSTVASCSFFGTTFRIEVAEHTKFLGCYFADCNFPEPVKSLSEKGVFDSCSFEQRAALAGKEGP